MNTMHTATTVTTKWSSSDDDQIFTVENPATGAVIATVAGCGPAQVGEAVEAANRAFGPWSRLVTRERATHLRQIAQVLREHDRELAELESSEVGKPVGQALNDVATSIDIFEMFSQYAAELPSCCMSGRCDQRVQCWGVLNRDRSRSAVFRCCTSCQCTR